jgi:DNA-binding transcriptional ArsR family regulator
MKPGGVKHKEDLLAWVNGQRQLDTLTKFILYRLALLADADCCAWMKVEDLADAVNKSERTIRYHLRNLEEAGLIKKTDRTHRLLNSTRSVPIYQLASGVEGLDRSVSMPAKIAGIPGDNAEHACNSEGGMPAIQLQPHKDMKGHEESADALSAREGALRERFDVLIEALPRRVLKFSDLDEAWAAFLSLVDGGVDPEVLIDCARNMAADRDFKLRKYVPPFEAWLAKGQWRGFLEGPEDEGGPAPSAAPERFDGPPEIRASIVATFPDGEGKARSYLDPSAWDPVTGSIVARTGAGFRWLTSEGERALKGRWRVVQREGVA